MQSSRILVPFGVNLMVVSSDGRTIGAKTKKKVAESLPPALFRTRFSNWVNNFIYKNIGRDV